MNDQDIFVSYGSSPKNPPLVVVPIGNVPFSPTSPYFSPTSLHFFLNFNNTLLSMVKTIVISSLFLSVMIGGEFSG